MALVSKKDFGRLLKQLNLQQKDIDSKRKLASGILPPRTIGDAIKKNKSLSLIYGFNKKGKPFTRDDLVRFQKRERAATRKFKSRTRGSPMRLLLDKSETVDIMRAKKLPLIRLVQKKYDTFTFAVASERMPGTSYKVDLKIENLQDFVRSYVDKRKLMGAVNNLQNTALFSINCQCGRFQFWYRYIATVGNYALVAETGYPKIRNPRLKGVLCKHLVRVFLSFNVPLYKKKLMDFILKLQSETSGFATSVVEIESGHGQAKANKELDRVYNKYLKANKIFAKEQSNVEKPKNLKRKVEKTKKTEKHSKLVREVLKDLDNKLKIAKEKGISKEKVFAYYNKVYKANKEVLNAINDIKKV